MSQGSLASQLSHQCRNLVHVRARIERALGDDAPQCLRHLVITSDTDYRTLVWFLMLMEEDGEIALAGGVIAPAASNGGAPGQAACALCAAEPASAVDGAADLADALARMRLTPSLFYGQRGITPETVLRRCDYMTRRGDVTGRRVVFLGDNDFQSVALALTQKPERIAVLDIDRRVLGQIEQAASERGLAIETWHHDLYEPLRPELRGSFDVFVFDPYPTPDASFEAMVVANGIDLLADGEIGAGYTFALPTHKFKQNSLALHRVLANSGLVVTDVVPRFAEFLPIEGELVPDEVEWIERAGGTDGLISHTKSLMRFETTDLTRAPEIAYDQPIETTSAGRREQLVRGMGTHYLLHAVGYEAQKGLVLETAADTAEWEGAFEGVDPDHQVDTMPVDRLVHEVVGERLDAGEVARLLDDPDRLVQAGSARGYSVTGAEAEALATLAARGYEGLEQAGLAADRQIRELYLAARVFASYFRGED